MNKIANIIVFIVVSINLFAGTIKGKVTLGLEKSVVPGISVLLIDQKVRFSTDANGEFTIPNLTNGLYTLEVSQIGYKRTYLENIEVLENQETTISTNLEESLFQFNEIVVTATRTPKQLSDVPIPTSVISYKEITSRSAVRLNEILSEQTGLTPVAFLGTGVQFQGLDPAYTLILVDGEPVIGRRGGTLDLKRISIGNVKHIEIVKGPTSALYGSDALAGVVNIITERSHQPFASTFSLRYGTYNSLDLSADMESQIEDVGLSFFIQRGTSDGYDFDKKTPSLTAPKFTNYTFSPRISYAFNPEIDLQLTSRVFLEKQEDPTVERTSLTDWSISPKLSYKFSSETKLQFKGYAAQYKNIEDIYADASGININREMFDQTLSKIEAEFSSTIKESYIVTAGAGNIFETIQADRIANGSHHATSYFAYAQNEWIPNTWFDLIASYRFDSHSDYTVRFSPKVSVMIRPTENITIRTSYGSGFKAPTFQQLYIDFLNPAGGGYSVFGAVGLSDRVEKEVQAGNIASILIDPNTIQRIRPEYSIAYNFGIDYEPIDQIFIRFNAFYNDINDLIETINVAQKNNGAFIYSYQNLNTVYTQGLESEIKFSPTDGLLVSLGYQYLEAKDKNILDDLRTGKIFKPTPTGARKVNESEYGGLFNRSPHTGNFKVVYDHFATGTIFNFVFIVRDQFGLNDMNGNLILDDKSEYVPGYALTNLSVTQEVLNSLTIQGGINNIFDKTNPTVIPSLSGRTIFGGITYHIK